MEYALIPVRHNLPVGPLTRLLYLIKSNWIPALVTVGALVGGLCVIGLNMHNGEEADTRGVLPKVTEAIVSRAGVRAMGRGWRPEVWVKIEGREVLIPWVLSPEQTAELMPGKRVRVTYVMGRTGSLYLREVQPLPAPRRD